MASIILAAVAAMAQDDVTKDWKHLWADAGEGSWLKFKVTHFTPIKAPDDSVEYEEHKGERKVTVVKTKGDFIDIQIENNGKKIHATTTIHIGKPGDLNYPVTKAGQEDVKVGDKTYSCTVYEFKAGGQVRKVWKAAGAPTWAVKEQFRIKEGDEDGWTEELTGTETLKVGGKEIVCAVIKKTTSMKVGKMTSAIVTTMWQSDQVPGRIVKKIDQNFMDGKEHKEMGGIEELVEFERK